MTKVFNCSFEVYGIVQGVSFRMYTQRQATSLRVRGWCMNTTNDTVKGEIEGYPEEFYKMKTWLENTGSPTSRIDKVVYGEQKQFDNFSFREFEIRH